jgi:hypothetical protein
VADLEEGKGPAGPPLFSRNLLSNVCKTQDILDPKYVIFLLFRGGGGFLERPLGISGSATTRIASDTLEKALAISFFDIKFLDGNSKTSDLAPKMDEILHFHIPPVQFF